MADYEHKGRLSGRQTLGGMGLLVGGAAAAAMAYAWLVEPLAVQLERLTIHLPNARGKLPAEGLRILHLSDTHFQGRAFRERGKIERVRRLVAGLEVDLLVHTGDFLHFDSGLENVRALLEVLPQPRLGAYAVFGNHDYRHYAMGEALPRMWRTFRQLDAARFESHGPPAWYSAATRWPRYLWYVRNTPLDGRRNGFNDCDQLATVLCAFGTTVLHNRAVHLTEPDGALDLYLAGIDDLGEGQPELGRALRGAPESALVVLLSHNPDIIAHPAAAQVDVLLAGHTHGGQLVLPFWGPAHTQSAHLSRRHVAGYFRQGQTHVYISRGLGEGIPLRFGARPQLALITLKAA